MEMLKHDSSKDQSGGALNKKETETNGQIQNHGRRHRYTVQAVQANEQNTACQAGKTTEGDKEKQRENRADDYDYGFLPSGPAAPMRILVC